MKVLPRAFVASFAIALAACTPGGGDDGNSGSSTGSATTYSGSWNCGSQNQCAIVMGSATGCRQFTSLAGCQSFFSNTTFGNSCGLGTCSATTPGSGPLSPISEILNGPNAAGQTSYWRIGGLYGQIGAVTDLALFADGTGRIIAGLNLCAAPIDQTNWTVTNQVPVASNFTWTATGPSSLVFTNAAYHCTADTHTLPGGNVLILNSLYTPPTSMSNISGGISSATFSATFVPTFRSSNTGTLFSGSF